MPALITHYLFGEEALNRGAAAGAAEVAECHSARRMAFDLGCQGPDPFFFAYTTLRGTKLHTFARSMHQGKVLEAFKALRACVDLLPERDRAVGTAFVCGLLAHYVLDRTAHPYVYALEGELCADPALTDAHHEVHAVLESDIDCGVLDHYRGCSTERFHPASVLESNDQAERTAGELLAHVGQELFGLPVHPHDYTAALSNMRTCYRVIEPHGSTMSRRLGALERNVRAHSQLEALAHRSDMRAGNPSMNPEHRVWVNPWTLVTSQESFIEVFERALEEYSLVVDAFLANRPLAGFVGNRDYGGRPLC